MKKSQKKVQGRIAPGRDGLSKKVVAMETSASSSASSDSDSSVEENVRHSSTSVPEPPTASGIFQSIPIAAADSNFKEAVFIVCNAHYDKIVMKPGDADSFACIFDERKYPKIRNHATMTEKQLWKQLKDMKNCASKLVLALTRMCVFEPFLLMAAKRLNSIPQFERYSKSF